MRLSLGASLPSKPKQSDAKHAPFVARPSAINTSSLQPKKLFNTNSIFNSKPQHLKNIGLQPDDHKCIIITLSLPRNHPAVLPLVAPIASKQEIADLLSDTLGIESFFIPQMMLSDTELAKLEPSTKAGTFLQAIRDDIAKHGSIAEHSYKASTPKINRERLLALAEAVSNLRKECGCKSLAEAFRTASFTGLNTAETKHCESTKSKCVRVTITFFNSVAHHLLALAVALAATTAQDFGEEFESMNDVAMNNAEGDKWKVVADRKRDSFVVATEMAMSAAAKRATNLHTGRPAVALWLQANITFAYHKFVEVDIMDFDKYFFGDTSCLATNKALRQWLESAATKEEEESKERAESKMDEEEEVHEIQNSERTEMHVDHLETPLKLMQRTTVQLLPQALLKLMKHKASNHCSVILRLVATREIKRPKLHLSKFELRRSVLRITPRSCSNMQDLCNAAMEQARESSTPGNSRQTSPWTPTEQAAQSPSPSNSELPRSILKGSGTRSRSVSFDNHEQPSYAQAAQGRTARSSTPEDRQTAPAESSDRAPRDTAASSQALSVSDIDRKMAETKKYMEGLQRERDAIINASSTNGNNNSCSSSSSNSNSGNSGINSNALISTAMINDIVKAVTTAVTVAMEGTLREMKEKLEAVHKRNNDLERAISGIQAARDEQTAKVSDEQRSKKRKAGSEEPARSTSSSLSAESAQMPSERYINSLQRASLTMPQPPNKPITIPSSQELTQPMPCSPYSSDNVSRDDDVAVNDG